MPWALSQSAMTLFLISIATVLIRSYFNSRRRHKLPPGPRGLSIVGNLHQFRKNLWFTFDRWCKEYGPIVYLNAAGQDMIILGTHKATSDLLDRRAGIYSDRPRLIVVNELMTGGLSLVFVRYSDLWKRMRRAAHEAMNAQAVKNYYFFQEVEAAILVSSLGQSPELYKDHLQRAANSLMLSIVYGIPPILDSQDPLIARMDDIGQQILTALLPGAHLVEFFTWMEHLPRWMCPWRRTAEAFFETASAEFCGLFDGVSSRLANGTQRPCVAATFIEESSRLNLGTMEAAWTAGTLYVAGAKTVQFGYPVFTHFVDSCLQTSTQMAWFLLAIVLHPKSQKRAHEELDQVVGRQRMPTFQDLDHLPYIRALVKEGIRWRPAMPMGGPHTTTEDDYYQGHFIPKGTLCFANIWGLNHDVDVYGPDANEFRPERFLGPDGTLVDAIPVDTKEEGHITYGFGRRICVGRHIANNTMFIQIASILWAFNIIPGYDGDGVAVLPDKDAFVDGGLSVDPAPFICQMSPRFEDAEEIVAATRDNRMHAIH